MQTRAKLIRLDNFFLARNVHNLNVSETSYSYFYFRLKEV